MNKKQKVNAVLEALSKDVPSFSLTKSAFTIREGLSPDIQDLLKDNDALVRLLSTHLNRFDSDFSSTVQQLWVAIGVALKGMQDSIALKEQAHRDDKNKYLLKIRTYNENAQRLYQKVLEVYSNFVEYANGNPEVLKSFDKDLDRGSAGRLIRQIEAYIQDCISQTKDISKDLEEALGSSYKEKEAPAQEEMPVAQEDSLEEASNSVEPVSKDLANKALAVAKRFGAIEKHMNSVLEILPTSGLTEDVVMSLVNDLTSDKRIIIFMKVYDTAIIPRSTIKLGESYVNKLDKAATGALEAFSEWRNKFNAVVEGDLNG